MGPQAAWPASWSTTIFRRICSWNMFANATCVQVCQHARPTGVSLVCRHKCVHSLSRGCVCSAHTQIQASTVRGARFPGPFTVAPVFKGWTGACLVFSAVPLWPPVPLPAVGGGGWGGGGRGLESRAGGRWLGSHLISPLACER